MEAGGYCEFPIYMRQVRKDRRTNSVVGSPSIHRCMCVMVQALLYAGGVCNLISKPLGGLIVVGKQGSYLVSLVSIGAGVM